MEAGVTVLVVGGAGYIGSHTAHVLRTRGYDVIIYDNLSTGHASLAEGFELIVGDIAESTKLSSALKRVDAVVHFAAHAYVGESVVNPQKYFRNNVVAGLALLDAVLGSKVPVPYTVLPAGARSQRTCLDSR
jgi:UDP-glucose 4-epimerase